MARFSRLLVLSLCFLPIFAKSVFADWHAWEDSKPEKGQLYMFVEMHACNPIEDRQILHITHFNPDEPEYHYLHNGWWDVTQETMWQWLQEGSRVYYHP